MQVYFCNYSSGKPAPLLLFVFQHQVTLKATLDAFGEDKDHLTPTTPLMYAARHNYHDIVKVRYPSLYER